MPDRTQPQERRVLERAVSAQGEIALRRAGQVYEIISNGVFLMDTSDGRSERLLVSAALARCAAPAPAVLIGGLGVGFSLAEAAGQARPARIDVVEISAEIIGWHSTHLRHIAATAWEDERVSVINADIAAWLSAHPGTYDIVCLDVDNGPDWTVTEGNLVLYRDEGLRLLAGALRDRGVVSVWSSCPSPAFERRLRNHFADVSAHEVAVARGEPDVVYAGRLPSEAESRNAT